MTIGWDCWYFLAVAQIPQFHRSTAGPQQSLAIVNKGKSRHVAVYIRPGHFCSATERIQAPELDNAQPSLIVLIADSCKQSTVT